MYKLLGAFLLIVVCQFSCSNQDHSRKEMPKSDAKEEKGHRYVELDGVSEEFSNYNVQGSFIWYDLKENTYYVYQQAKITERHPPASTFKIFNALIALEEEVIKDTLEVIPWDGVDRNWNKWNQDQTLGSGMRYSALWAYREIARSVEKNKKGAYQRYLDSCKYGNRKKSESDDLFWLDNSLQISPIEQIEFLVRFYQGELPFSENNIELVKQIIKVKDFAGGTFSGKTGWAIIGEQNIAWYVGYFEIQDKVYFFCTKLEKEGPIDNKGSFRKTYMDLTESIIRKLLP